MHPEDIPKTAITTPFGTFTFYYSCFGLRNSGATYQRMVDGILGNLPFCACYIDDILIFSTSKEEHLQHLTQVLELLQENCLVVRYDKCVLHAREVDFLGHHISPDGVAPHSYFSQGLTGISPHGQLLSSFPAQDSNHHGTTILSTSRQTQGSDVGPPSRRGVPKSKRRPCLSNSLGFSQPQEPTHRHHGCQ